MYNFEFLDILAGREEIDVRVSELMIRSASMVLRIGRPECFGADHALSILTDKAAALLVPGFSGMPM